MSETAVAVPGRRTTKVLRNLDDTLRIAGFLTLRSAGLVMMFFCVLHGINSYTPFGRWIFGGWSFVAELGVVVVVTILLSKAEKQDDEHFVPSAIAYYLSRPSSHYYSGAGARSRGARRLRDILER